MPPKVWTTGRKLMGNLVPLAMALPFAVIGVWRLLDGEPPTGAPLAWIAAMPVVGWISVNLFGLYQNETMREETQRRLGQAKVDLGDRRTFVGFARPGRSGLLDAHEDVGYLIERPDEIEFVGERHQVTLPRSAVRRVRFRNNVHSLVGLGRWVAVEGEVAEKPVRLLVEPRECATLLGNRRHSRKLKAELEAWARRVDADPASAGP